MNSDADRHVQVIGIGAGDPAWLTLEAVRALEALDVAFVFQKGADDELAAARRALLPEGVREVVIEDPPRGRGAEAVAAWRAERVRLVREAVAAWDGNAGFLAWGDPTLYDGLIGVLREAGFGVRVVPGISAVSALAARFGVALNRVAGAVLITTGRRLEAGWPSDADDVVVMLDAGLAFRAYPRRGDLLGRLPRHAGRDPAVRRGGRGRRRDRARQECSAPAEGLDVRYVSAAPRVACVIQRSARAPKARPSVA